MAEEWTSATRVQKNDAGEFRAEINGQWVPVAKAQKNDAGEFRVMLPSAPVVEEKGGFLQGLGNLAAGAVRGAGSIGATILSPIDALARAAGVQNDFIGRDDRRAQMDAGLQTMGAQPDSLLYQGGKLGAEVAGTAGVGGAMAKGVQAVANAPKLAAALTSGGLNIGAPAATALGRVGDMALRAGGGAAVGGASAGLVNPSDAGMGATIGAAIPVAGKAIGAGANAVGNALRGGAVSPERAALANVAANKWGINIPADRVVDSKPLNAVAAALEYMPFSGRAAVDTQMQNQLNKALTSTFGQNSTNVTKALRNADDVLGAEFERVLKNNSIRPDMKFVQDLAEVSNLAHSELPEGIAKVITNKVDELVKAAESGDINGQLAYNIKKRLDEIGRRNSSEAYYARQLKGKLMEALDRSLGEDAAKAFAKTREQYSNMLRLDKLAKNGSEGDISIARIANMKNIGNKDMQELADIAADFLKPREGQHGAAQRAMVGLMGANMAGIPGLVAGASVGRGANMLLNSNALRNQMLGQGNPALGNALANIPLIAQRTAPVLSAQ